MIDLAEQTVGNAVRLRKAGEGSELDVVQLEVDLERYRADRDATARSLPAAVRRLAASVGAGDLPDARVVGDLEAPLPDYDPDRVRAFVVGVHPDLRAAQVGVERARLALDRAAAEPIPNVTLGTGYSARTRTSRPTGWSRPACRCPCGTGTRVTPSPPGVNSGRRSPRSAGPSTT
ncbi:MAG: hypothetical protein K2X87_23450 [Gemmataceae bacterium]|nr:hypothetical protein [Gemmataceae bacterium]